MTSLTDTAARPVRTAFVPSALYRAIWRWHFYAGLIAVPFLILLSVTGGLYLFQHDIDRTVFAHRNVVAPAATPALAPSVLVEKALAAVPGTAAAYRAPADATSSARVQVTAPAGKIWVYVDPYTGRVLGSVDKADEFNQVVRKIHSLEFFGTGANRLIEAAAGLAILLVVTGVVLWWPRGRKEGVVTIRPDASRRPFWRDLHAVTGVFAGGLLAFLALTGLPWSGYWGSTVNTMATEAGVGYPEQLWDAVPTSTVPAGEALDKTAWTLEGSPMPLSVPSPAGATVSAIGIDRAVETARKLGIAPGFEVTFPGGADGVYTAAIYPPDLAAQRTIHLDQYSGSPLVDLRYADYGSVAKATEWGINVHMGQEFGRANQLLMAAVCVATIVFSVAAVVMWWKRRPSGRLGIPPLPSRPGVYAALWAAVLAVGALFPMTGIAVLVMLAVDVMIPRRPLAAPGAA